MRELAAPVEVAGDDLLDTAGTGGGACRPSTSRRRPRFVAAGRGLPRRQARQPLGHEPVAARPTCSRRSARASTSTPEAVARVHRRGRLRVHVRAGHHQATRHVVPVRKALGRAHDLQLPRPAHEPGRRHAPADRRRRPGLRRADRRRARAARRASAPRSCRARTAWTRSASWPRRGLLEVTPDGVTAAHGLARSASGSSAPTPSRSAGGTPERERGDHARRARRASRGRAARSSCLNAGAALFVGRPGVPSFEEGVRLAEEAIDSGAALDTLERFVPQDRRAAPRRRPA